MSWVGYTEFAAKGQDSVTHAVLKQRQQQGCYRNAEPRQEWGFCLKR